MNPGVGVGVIILKGNNVLFGKRHEDPTKADSALRGEGTWCIPGGKLDFGERFEDAAKREVLEETGIKAHALELVSLSNDFNEHAHFATVGFLCRDYEGEPEVMEPDEIVEWRWFPLDQLPKPMFFPSERIIRNYIDREFYKP